MGVRNGAEGRRGLWRSRWAAIGAAVAVTFGGGGFFVAQAASGPASSVVTVTPERILDTRTGVGLSGPFVSAVSRKLQVTGAVVPAGATGVLLNVTVVQPSAAGFLSVRPGDATGTPSTSSLNFTAGDIVPNSVQVALPTSGANAGQIDITYDAFGVSGPTTNVLADVVGYLVAGGGGATGPAGPKGDTGPAGPTDPALLARINALEAANSALSAKIVALETAQPFAVTARNDFETVTPTDEVVVAVSVTAPVAGQVTVNSTTSANEGAGDFVTCSITTGTTIDFNYAQLWQSPGGAGFWSQLSGTRTFNVAAGATRTYNLVCDSDSATLNDSVLTAIFTPAP